MAEGVEVCHEVCTYFSSYLSSIVGWIVVEEALYKMLYQTLLTMLSTYLAEGKTVTTCLNQEGDQYPIYPALMLSPQLVTTATKWKDFQILFFTLC